ncbi:MAG TPA: hypothetical protein DCS93_12305 [Microscillaceae bacterium]|nr:hypothetical protein [Microscillaceae bacterium]
MLFNRFLLPIVVLLFFVIRVQAQSQSIAYYSTIGSTVQCSEPYNLTIPKVRISIGKIDKKDNRAKSMVRKVELASKKRTSVSTSYHSKDDWQIISNIKQQIRNVLAEFASNKQVYDFRYEQDDKRANLFVYASFKIETDGSYRTANAEKQELTIWFEDTKAKNLGEFTVFNTNNFLRDQEELGKPIRKVVNFLIQSRIPTHSVALDAEQDNQKKNPVLESVVLKTQYFNAISKCHQQKFDQLLTNMFLNVQKKERRSKSFNFRVSEQGTRVRKNEIVAFMKMTKSGENKYKIDLKFTKNEKEFFRSKQFTLDGERIDNGNFVEFMTMVFPQINYLRTHNF